MSFTHSIQVNWLRGTSGEPLAKTISTISEAEINVDIDVPIQADFRVQIQIILARLKSFYLVAGEDLTLETNNATTPIDTKTLKKNIPLIWVAGAGMAAIFTADVTDFYFTNASANVAAVNIRGLVDATP